MTFNLVHDFNFGSVNLKGVYYRIQINVFYQKN